MSTPSPARTPPPRLSLKGAEDDGIHESVATFVSKLWNMLGKDEYKHLIAWSKNGDTFIVKDSNKFAKEVLPFYFKHNNFNSFVRQLNLYGFRKMNRSDFGGLSKSEDVLEFWHSQFHQTSPHTLHLVHRRVSHKDDNVEKNPHRLSAVISDIHQMKGRQEGIANVLEALKQDNSHLRHQIGVLQDKHIKQQKILNKIIHFLVHMVYSKGKIPSTGRPTRQQGLASRLMLMDADILAPQGKRMRMADTSPIEELPITDLDSPNFEFSGLPTMSPTMLNTAASMFAPPTSSSLIPAGLASSLPVSSPIGVLSPPSELSISSVTSPPAPSSPLPPSATSSQIPSTAGGYDTVTVLSSSASPSKSADVNFDPAMIASPPSVSAVTSPPSASTVTSPPSAPYSATPLGGQFPQIPEDLHETYPIPPAPSSLVPVPHPENRMCLHGQLEHQQMGLDSLPDFISNHLNLDQSVLSDLVMSSDHVEQLPEYDIGDTARLLEALTNFGDPGALNLGALVPVQAGGGTVDMPLFLPAASAATTTSSSSSSSAGTYQETTLAKST